MMLFNYTFTLLLRLTLGNCTKPSNYELWSEPIILYAIINNQSYLKYNYPHSFFIFYFFKQTTRTQEPSPHYCTSTGQNSKLFSHPLFTFYWLYTRERCGLHQNRGERRVIIPLRKASKKWWWGDCLEGFFHQTRGREGESLLWWFFDPFPSKYASKQATKYDVWIWSIQSDHNSYLSVVSL